MAINWRTDYAIRLMCEVASLGEGARDTVRRTAESTLVPYDYARTIARDLVSAGLLASRRGVGGGIELARPAAEITILDIFNAMGEPATISLCTVDPTVCSRSASCSIHHDVWQDLDGMIRDYLASKTLAATVRAGGSFEVPTLV